MLLVERGEGVLIKVDIVQELEYCSSCMSEMQMSYNARGWMALCRFNRWSPP